MEGSESQNASIYSLMRYSRHFDIQGYKSNMGSAAFVPTASYPLLSFLVCLSETSSLSKVKLCRLRVAHRNIISRQILVNVTNVPPGRLSIAKLDGTVSCCYKRATTTISESTKARIYRGPAMLYCLTSHHQLASLVSLAETITHS